MAIEQADIQKIRAAADIAAVIGEHTALKRVGRRLVGLCPFHSESTPSFTVSTELGVYHCFGCQASGDVINFVCEIEGVTFVEAVNRLAARLNIEINTETDAHYQKRSKWKDLASVMSQAVDFYHEQLLRSESARAARQYLRQRGYDSSIVKQFKLGYAPPDSAGISAILSQKTDLAVEAGLLSYSAYQKNYVDIFRDRVIFPIFDSGNTPIALGGRILPEEFRTLTTQAGPKYRNTKESVLYSKRKTLYGLNLAKKEMSHQSTAIVCEGYTDVIAFHKIGENTAVATCGTALTEHHIKTLSNFSKKIILSFDADLAGQEAMAKLYDWEEKHDISLMVAKLPEGSDPAELALADPDSLKHAVNNAQPYLGFLVERYTDKVSGLHPEERAKAAQKSLLAISSHPNSLVREEYLAKTADMTRLPVGELRAQLQNIMSGSLRLGSDKSKAQHFVDEAGNMSPKKAARQSTRDNRGTNEGRQSNNAYKKNRYGGTEEVNLTLGSSVSQNSGNNTRRKASPASTKGPISGEIALLLAIHRPETVVDKLTAMLFTDQLQRRSFTALAESESLVEAIENAEEDVRQYLYRLSGNDIPEGSDIEDIISSLCVLSAEKKIESVLLEARMSEKADALQNASRIIEFAKHRLEIIKTAQTNGVYTDGVASARESLLDWLYDGTTLQP